jgi:hypothetical protein
MSAMVKDLHDRIAAKKTALAPLIKDLRAARAEVAELEAGAAERAHFVGPRIAPFLRPRRDASVAPHTSLGDRHRA